MASNPPGSILRYRNKPEYAENDILIIDSSDIDIVRLDFAKKMPSRCFSALTENIDKYELVFKHYVKYRFAPSCPRTWTTGDSTHMLFFTLWEKLVEDFNAALPRSVLWDVQTIRGVKLDFFPNLDAILNVLELVTIHLMMPCLEGSPFYGRGAQKKPRQWSTQYVDWLQDLALVVNSLERARRALAPLTVPMIDGLLLFVRDGIRAWQAFAKMDGRGKCFTLSSYTFGLAELFEERGQYGVSLLLLHRALDLYFIFCAIGAGLLVETYNGFEYTGSFYRSAVNVYQSFKILDGSGFFAPGLNAEPQIRFLNDARNLHLMTHQVYGITESELKGLRTVVGTLIQSIEGVGNGRWTQARHHWFPMPRIDPKCLFESEPSISTYLSEVV